MESPDRPRTLWVGVELTPATLKAFQRAAGSTSIDEYLRESGELRAKLTAPEPPRYCSECGRWLTQKATGRWRITCGAACRQRRAVRLRREVA